MTTVYTTETTCQACGCSEWTLRDRPMLSCASCDRSMLLAVSKERDALHAEVEMLIPKGFHASAGQCVEPDMLRGDDGGHQYCGLRAEVERITRDRDRLLKDLQDIAKGCGVGVPDREEAKRIIIALCTAAKRGERSITPP